MKCFFHGQRRTTIFNSAFYGISFHERLLFHPVQEGDSYFPFILSKRKLCVQEFQHSVIFWGLPEIKSWISRRIRDIMWELMKHLRKYCENLYCIVVELDLMMSCTHNARFILTRHIQFIVEHYRYEGSEPGRDFKSTTDNGSS